MKGNWKRRGIAWLLTVAMIMTTVGNNWLLGSAAENDETTVSAAQIEESGTESTVNTADGAEESAAAEETSGGEELSLTDVFTYGEEELTWAQAGRILAGLLGFIEEDVANVDLTAYVDRISSLSLDDDSFYLAILAENGYLDGVSEVIDPSAVISEETYESLLTEAFAATAFTQEDAEALVSQEEPDNLAISGEEIFLNAYEAGRIALGENDSLELSSVTAQAISVTDADAELDLDATEIERVLVNGGGDDGAEAAANNDESESVANEADTEAENTTTDAATNVADDTADGEDAENADDADVEDSARLYIHIDSESGLPEVILEQADDVVIEGSGSLGVVRVTGEVGSLTVRATGSVINEADEDFTVTGPDHEEVTLAPGEQVEFVLTGYLVSFRTEGTPVESQTVTPGGAVDFTLAQTELDGMIFTAWYTDEEYTEPYSMLNTVDEETTLYARFVDEADAVTVAFETFGGRELEPLVFAKGETLLTKDITSLYTSKDGYTFGGWCVDEDCTEAFSYTDPIEESMTLYALFASNEVVEEEDFGTVAELDDLDWQAGIALVLPDGMTFLEAMTSVEIEAGTGGEEPSLSFRETDGGVEVYGSYYEDGGESGFEPGATFTLTVSNGVQFDGYEDYIDTLTVSVYKETVETVTFADGLTWVLWENVTDFVPSVDDGTSYEAELDEDGELDETEMEGETIPGSLVLTDASVTVQAGDIVVFYDGEVGNDEMNISAWEEGSLDGYVLYAEISDIEETEQGTKITFLDANPADFLTDLDAHTTREVDLEDALGEEAMAQLERAISAQVSANEELSAQLLVSVMSAQETQDELDAIYGDGVYSLAAISASIKVNTPSVKLSSNGSTVTAGITVSAKVTLKDGNKTVLVMTPSLTFIQDVTVNTSVDGGFIWIDMAITIQTKSTIRLEVTATSGGDTGVLSDAKETFETLISPDGLDDSMDYDESASQLMETMQSLIATELSYNDLFSVTLLYVRLSFYGIITFTVELDFVGQIGVLATFGIEIVVTNGQRIGFNYNFLKFKGGSYKEKLPGDVVTNIYLIGKVGVRLGLRLTLSLSLCTAKASISGEIFAYAELTGMYYYTASLLSGSSTSVGALYFEVGLDAAVKLSLSVKIIFKTYKKSWTVWSDRWPLYSLSRSSKMTYMDTEKLDTLWAKATENADRKSSYRLDVIPMKTWNLIDGCQTCNELLWESTDRFSFEVTAVTVNGEALEAGDERWDVFYVGDGTDGSLTSRVYVNEDLAVAYEIMNAACEVTIIYEDTSTSALIKRQTHTLNLERKFEVATTTVNVSVVLYDWCSHAWGIESAAWDGATVYTDTFVTAHLFGSGVESTATGDIDLASVEAAVRSEYTDLASGTLTWYDPTRNSLYGAVEYSVPKTSNFCYLTPATGTIRYDVRPGTDEYSLTFYLYARRFEGYEEDITYIVRLIGAEEGSYAFQVNTGMQDLTFTPNGSTENEWILETKRTLFSGTAHALMMSIDGSTPTDTGYSISGREISDTVIFEIDLNRVDYELTIVMGDGIAGYTATAASSDTQVSVSAEDQTASSEAGQTIVVKVGADVALDVEVADGYRNLELVFEPAGTEYTLTDGEAGFAMPRYDVTVTLRAYKINTLTYEYNYGNLGTYTSQMTAANETTEAPLDPLVEGMTFRGWYLSADCSGDPYEFGSAPTQDMTLYADWTCDVTVVFGNAAGEALYLNENGNSVSIFENDTTEYHQFTYSTLRVGETLLDIVPPDYSGHDFMGWYLTADYSGEAFDLTSYTLTGGVTIYAYWIPFVSVIYDWNDGGSEMYFGATEHLGLAMENIPANPEREHYTFTGWYSGKACVEDQRVDLTTYLPQGDVTFYAGWTANDYTITYDLQGGETAAANPTTYTIETEDITLTVPTRTGYTFAGWTGSGLEEATMTVIIPTGTTGTLSYTATWKPITYSITYNLVRGTLTAEIPASYTIESADIILATPEKEGYIFEGWIGTDLTEATLNVTIPTGSTGDRSYTAVWSTTDPSAIIADNAIGAVEGTYTYELDDYQEGTEESSSIYQTAWEALESDAEAGFYVDDLTLTLTLAEEGNTDNPVEDEISHTWTFTATIVYTDDDGNETKREGTVTAIVNKRVPTLTAPTASDLEYGNALSLSALTGGSASYEESGTNAGAGTESTAGNTVTVEGSFIWMDDTIVPKAADNGREIYSVTFTPADTATYAVVTMNIAVSTQTGVEVYIGSVDSRYYIAETTQTTGTYVLLDADTGEDITSVLPLSGGTYHFSQTAVGTYIDVTFSGYTSADTTTLPGGMIPKYVLTNGNSVTEMMDTTTGTTSTARADILQVPFGTTGYTELTVAAKPTAAAITYGDLMIDSLLNGGSVSVTYNYDYYKASVDVEGTWSWTALNQTANAAGEQTYSVTFTPKDTYSYVGGTADITVSVAKKTVDAPTIASKTYTGSNLTADITSSAIYTIVNDGGTDVGDYDVILTLNNADNYEWSDTAKAAGTISGSNDQILTLTFTIEKVTLTVDASGAAVTPIGYGATLVSGTGSKYSANEMISGVAVSFGGTNVPGTWSWTESSLESLTQPLNVSDTGYEVVAEFTPTYPNYYTVTKTFTVKVVKSTPDVENVTVTASEMFSWGYTTVQSSTLTAEGSVKNPIDSSIEVEGTWTWENTEYCPTKNKNECTAKFVPTDIDNYEEATKKVTVPITTEMTVVVGYYTTNGNLLGDPSAFSKGLYGSSSFKATGTTGQFTLSDSAEKSTLAVYHDIGTGTVKGFAYTYNCTTLENIGNVGTTVLYGILEQYYITDVGAGNSTTAYSMSNGAITFWAEGTSTDGLLITYIQFNWEVIQPRERVTKVLFTGDFGASTSLSSASSSLSLSAVAGARGQMAAATETRTETEEITEAQTEMVMEAQTEAAAEAQTITDADTGGSGETQSTETQTEAATEAQTEAGTEKQTEAATEAQTEAQTEAAIEKQTEAATETAVETQ